jgi:integrase
VAKFHHSLRHIPIRRTATRRSFPRCSAWPRCGGCVATAATREALRRIYTEHKRERFLSAAELKRLGELMKLRWEHVDIEGAILRLPDSKAGAKAVHLGHAAIDVLAATGRLPFNPHERAPSPGQPLSDLQPFWCRVRARAGIKDVRIHDMRHTFASVAVAVASGQGLPMIGKLLGHAQVQTTARYATSQAIPCGRRPTMSPK